MKFFHIQGIINEKLLDEFLSFCNTNVDDDWTFILNSGGGKQNLMLSMLHIINNRPEKCCIISCGAYSSGFYLFYYAKCQKKMTEDSYGMMHLCSSDMRMQSNHKPAFTEDEVVVKNWKETDTDIRFAKLFMTPTELQKFKRGNDIYFTFKRMKEIFPDVEVIK